MVSAVTSSPFVGSPPSISILHSPPSPSTVRFSISAMVAQSAPSTCPYEVLRVPMGASGKEIKAAYRRLARICHPDVAADSPEYEFVTINAAYSTLSDPVKRAEYDRRKLRWRHGGGAAAAVVMRSGGYGYRKWETDQCW